MAEEANGAASGGAGSALPAVLAGWLRPGPQLWIALLVSVFVIALVVAMVLWSTTPSYSVLYRGLSDQDAGQILDALQKANIPVRLDAQSGAITVPADVVHEARFKLASQGLPRGSVNGFEAFEQQSVLGTSQFMESARYQHALEGELARSVMTIGSVQNARIHLAMPKESVFVRNRQPPSASVVVQLQPGRSLDEGQVAAITHLVSSSVPKMSHEQVSVIDQFGNLLSRSGRQNALGLSLDQLDYTKRVEERYIKRIEDIVTPLFGVGRMRAQVALTLDFNETEETSEAFDPRQANGIGMMRSEKVLEDSSQRARAEGVPGALSNQPPDPATIADPNQPQTTSTESAAQQRQRLETVRNYELDKRVSHVKASPGRVKRVSAAVVVDDRISVDAAGAPVRTPLTQEELDRVTSLVREAVGFDSQRGDTVHVVNASFAISVPAELGPPPLWQQDWFLTIIKWVVIGIIAVLLFMMVIRPLMRRVVMPYLTTAMHGGNGAMATANGAPALPGQEGAAGLPALGRNGNRALGYDGDDAFEDDQVTLSSVPRLPNPAEQLDVRLQMAKTLVAEDPRRAVQVIRGWIVNEVDDDG